jgi:hypothetical protein
VIGRRYKHKPYVRNPPSLSAAPGWPSWLGRKTHRVLAKSALVLRHLEVAGSNPAPGTYLLVILSLTALIPIGAYNYLQEISEEIAYFAPSLSLF